MKKSFLLGSLLTASCWLVHYLNNKNQIAKKSGLLVPESKPAENKLTVVPQPTTALPSRTANPVQAFSFAKSLQLPVVSDHDLGQSSMRISSKQQAVDWVACHFGDNHGDWEWNCIWENADGYFVKAISKQLQAAGSMTGTAMSVLVKKDGKMDWNF